MVVIMKPGFSQEELQGAIRAMEAGGVKVMVSQGAETTILVAEGDASRIDQEKVVKMRTAMLTKYPENKEVRGIMKLVSRTEDKKNGFKLTYEADLIKGRTEEQTLAEWIRREKKWQESRAKTMK